MIEETNTGDAAYAPFGYDYAESGGLDVQLSNFTSMHSGSYHLVPSHNRSAFPPGGTTHQCYDIFVPWRP